MMLKVENVTFNFIIEQIRNGQRDFKFRRAGWSKFIVFKNLNEEINLSAASLIARDWVMISTKYSVVVEEEKPGQVSPLAG